MGSIKTSLGTGLMSAKMDLVDGRRSNSNLSSYDISLQNRRMLVSLTIGGPYTDPFGLTVWGYRSGVAGSLGPSTNYLGTNIIAIEGRGTNISIYTGAKFSDVVMVRSGGVNRGMSYATSNGISYYSVNIVEFLGASLVGQTIQFGLFTQLF